ncbi:unnamed protein product [Phytophthora fragariaefolia]|uniref:Unnamed protein product n=1 Tax=Phytophthora fragariaefolia TaxID=1490495 RepID=A0A9W6XFI8_9STRA|nr:unnamed protein product [Phytophthora fragariaefolia]
MCNYLTKDGIKCKLSPKKDICHIHWNYSIIDPRSNEIRNLNRSIAKANIKTKNLREEVSYLKEDITFLQSALKDKDSIISSMKKEYDQYIQIKQFEMKKARLSKYVHDMTDIYGLKTFCRSNVHELTLSEIFGEHDDYWRHDNELRIQRNKVCHEFSPS